MDQRARGSRPFLPSDSIGGETLLGRACPGQAPRVSLPPGSAVLGVGREASSQAWKEAELTPSSEPGTYPWNHPEAPGTCGRGWEGA